MIEWSVVWAFSVMKENQIRQEAAKQNETLSSRQQLKRVKIYSMKRVINYAVAKIEFEGII